MSLALGMELPCEANTTRSTGARVFIQQSRQHGAGNQLLKKENQLENSIYHDIMRS